MAKENKGGPARLVIGVTGHRHVRSDNPAAARIPEILKLIKRRISVPRDASLGFTILSPLAEGADRLVAREILKLPGARLEAVLPMDKDSYLLDFKTPESKREFERLLGLAAAVHVVAPSSTRVEAYGKAGRFVVDNCRVLIALWDGRVSAGSGGTAETVAYARSRRRPLYWLNTDGSAALIFEPGLEPPL